MERCGVLGLGPNWSTRTKDGFGKPHESLVQGCTRHAGRGRQRDCRPQAVGKSDRELTIAHDSAGRLAGHPPAQEAASAYGPLGCSLKQNGSEAAIPWTSLANLSTSVYQLSHLDT